jgi:hypothetical protein
MSLHPALFCISVLTFVGYLIHAARHADTGVAQGRWKLPAALSAAFLLFSIYTGWTEGPLGFLTEHTRTLWSNQIWFDLLLGVSIALWWMLPRARARRMRIPLWLGLVAATGNVGLLAMLARLWWLEEHAAKDLVT